MTNTSVGQLLLIGISGLSLTAEEKKFIAQKNIGGVTLFARNLQEPVQIRDLCAELQSLRQQMPDKAPLYIAIDMEGGRVARLKQPFTQWPPLKKLGDLDSPSATFHFAHAMGLELKSVGINVDWAPCLDVLTNPANTVIGDRALSSNAETVAKHASALVRGYLKAEVIPCAKHFPGHGNTFIDSHTELPVEDLDSKRMEAVESLPFRRAFRSRLELLMTAHVLYKNIDPDWPVTLSSKFLQDILRDQLRYRGLVVTDDLGMKALSKYHEVKKIPVRAIQAGADLLLYCNEPDSPGLAYEAINEALSSGELKPERIKQIHQRVLLHKSKYLTTPDPMSAEEIGKIVGHSKHLQLAKAISEGVVPENLSADLADGDT